ncbi:MAG TPA: hypothetical protein VGJ26_17945 [Pirellulales bacterium]|jgi:hypothetical protein
MSSDLGRVRELINSLLEFKHSNGFQLYAEDHEREAMDTTLNCARKVAQKEKVTEVGWELEPPTPAELKEMMKDRREQEKAIEAERLRLIDKPE